VLNAFRYPFKHLLEVIFCLAVLAGIGAQSLLDRRRGASTCVAFAALVAVWVLAGRPSTFRVASSAIAVATTLGFFLLVVLGRRREAVALALVSIWLGFAGNRDPLIESLSAGQRRSDPRPPMLEMLLAREPTQLGPRYVALSPFSPETSLGLDYPTEFRVPAVHGTSPFLWGPLSKALAMTDNGHFMQPWIFVRPEVQVWDVLAARYFSATQPIAGMGAPIFRAGPKLVANERTRTASPIRFVDRAECMAPAAIMEELYRREYDFSTVALLDCTGQAELPALAPSRTRGAAKVVESEPGLLRLRVQLKGSPSGMLVVSQADVPGWRARIDGQPAPLYRAYGLVQALVVPPGTHEVILEYWPESFALGRAISLATLALVAGAVGWASIRVKQRRAAWAARI
jgi:hypothetical protein